MNMPLQLAKYWLLTSPHVQDLPVTHPKLSATFAEATLPVASLMASLDAVI